MQDLPENHFRVSEAFWVIIINYQLLSISISCDPLILNLPEDLAAFQQ